MISTKYKSCIKADTLRFIIRNIFMLSLSINVFALPDGSTIIRVGEIRLGMLNSAGEIDYYEIDPSYPTPMMSAALFGHIHTPEEPGFRYLTSPVLVLERRSIGDTSGNWTRVVSAQSPGSQIEIARIQNYRFEPNYRYRLGAGTDSSRGGRYALVVDPAMEGCEFEVEDLDLGKDAFDRHYSLYTAYTVPDPNSPYGERVYAGTEYGYILCSDDDAQTWRQIYPPDPFGEPLHGTVFGIFVDSQGIIYASPWTSADQALNENIHGLVIESRDGGATWSTAITLGGATGVAWRFAEDCHGNVFVGEYCAVIKDENAPLTPGNVWRRQNHGNGGEAFEVVYANPRINPDTMLNHTHFVGVDPYTDEVYAAIGDGAVGRFIRSRSQGDPGTWETLERGVDSQYTAIAFTPQYLYLGTDTDKQFKKIVRWDKTKDSVEGNEPFWTTTMMENEPGAPIPWADKGNWFWGYYLDERVLVFQYMAYGLPMENGQMQPPRMYATCDHGETWRRAITFPPNPIREVLRFGESGPKLSSNVSPSGWIYATWGTATQEIHRGFRFRLKPQRDSGLDKGWMEMK